ncbi:MAG TPA: hypothetical protein VD866_27695 [Urbifossiella sp.]|nr:hypothetical protein [Urbifossiella sp.]
MTVTEILARYPWMEEPLRTYYHALPELLADRTAGTFVIVTAGELHDTWDTFRDANQFACRLLEPETFIIQRIDARQLAFLAEAFGPIPAETTSCHN